MPVLTIKGQQRLSYAYDAAGNRISRTIVVGASNATEDSQNESSRYYAETLGEMSLSIHSDLTGPRFTISLDENVSPSTGEYSILDSEGNQLVKKGLSGGSTLVDLEKVPSGNYTLNIHLNGHLSEWELVKL